MAPQLIGKGFSVNESGTISYLSLRNFFLLIPTSAQQSTQYRLKEILKTFRRKLYVNIFLNFWREQKSLTLKRD